MKIIDDTTITTDSEAAVGKDEVVGQGILAVAREVAVAGQDSAYLVCDVNAINARYEEVVEKGLKNIAKPRFDIFCNSSPFVLHHLSDLGFEFRARNKNEVKLAASAGIPADRITLHSQAPLVASHLRYAAAEGVGKVVVRSAGDLKKIRKEFPNARILLSLKAATSGNSSSVFDQGLDLMRQSSQLNLRVAGLAFEEDEGGIGGLDVRKQLALVKLLLAVGRNQLGLEGLDVVHLGTVRSTNEAAKMFSAFENATAAAAGAALTVGFSDAAVASAFVLCAKVIGKRATPMACAGSGVCKRTIVINEGVFGHFGKLLHSDHQLPSPCLLRDIGVGEQQRVLFCDILGPSGDDADVIGLCLPITGPDIQVGDWIAFPCMGSEVLTPANPRRNVSIPSQAGSQYRIFISDDNIKAVEDDQTGDLGGSASVRAEECLTAAENLALACNDTDLMTAMLSGLK